MEPMKKGHHRLEGDVTLLWKTDTADMSNFVKWILLALLTVEWLAVPAVYLPGV